MNRKRKSVPRWYRVLARFARYWCQDVNPACALRYRGCDFLLRFLTEDATRSILASAPNLSRVSGRSSYFFPVQLQELETGPPVGDRVRGHQHLSPWTTSFYSVRSTGDNDEDARRRREVKMRRNRDPSNRRNILWDSHYTLGRHFYVRDELAGISRRFICTTAPAWSPPFFYGKWDSHLRVGRG